MADKMMRVAGRDKNSGNAKGLSTEIDPSGNGVLRVVDAAPFAYDVEKNAIQIISDELLSTINNSGFTGLDINEMPIAKKLLEYDPNVKYIFPLQEPNSKVAHDLKDGFFYGQKYGIATKNTDGTETSRRVALFGKNKTKPSFMVLPSVAGIAGLSDFTWMAMVEIKDVNENSGQQQTIYSESTANMAEATRFQVIINSDNTLTANIRTDDVTVYTIRTTQSLDVGYHFVFVGVNVPNKAMSFYVDGGYTLPVTKTGTMPTRSAVVSDVSQLITVGVSGFLVPPKTLTDRNYTGGLSYLGLTSKFLNTDEMRELCRLGGFRV